MSIIVTGIHTGIGKTICSAVLCQALGYDYWKPVQAGDLNNSDSIFIANTVTHPLCKIHKETYRLNTAASPHYAAAVDGIEIKKEAFALPASGNKIIVETAGGIMSPLANDLLVIDLVKQLNLPVLIVSNNYLGSINHTLLSIAALQQKNIEIKGLVFSGSEVAASQSFITAYTGVPLLFTIPEMKEINAAGIKKIADGINLQ